MLRSLTLLLCCSLLLFSCKNNTAETPTEDQTDRVAPTEDQSDSAGPTATIKSKNSLIKSGDSEEMITIKKGLAAHISSNMIESVDLKNGILTINYFKDAAGFLTVNEGKRMDDETFIRYWTTGNRAEKVITLIPAQVLNSFSAINQVEAILHTGTETWTSKITRDELAKHTKKTWATIQEDFDQHIRFGLAAFPDARNAYIEAFVIKN